MLYEVITVVAAVGVVELASGTRDMACAVGLGAYLAKQVDLDGVVDGNGLVV